LLPASKIKARRGTKISPIKGTEPNEEGTTLDKHVNDQRTKSVRGLPNRLSSPLKNNLINNDSLENINNNNSPGTQSIQR
jgi:hypothetical protein